MDEFSVSFTKDASNPARPIKSVLNATNDDYSLTYDQNANMVVVFVFCPMFLLIVFLFLPFLHRLYGVHSVYFLFVRCFPTLRFDSVLNKYSGIITSRCSFIVPFCQGCACTFSFICPVLSTIKEAIFFIFAIILYWRPITSSPLLFLPRQCGVDAASAWNLLPRDSGGHISVFL